MSVKEFVDTLVASALLPSVYRALEPCWPHEGCGFVFSGADGALVHVPTRNRAQQLHEMDPENYPRDATRWFEPDMKPWLRSVREGLQPRLIYHSHPDVGAYFSDSDQESAILRDGDVTLERHPGVLHLVVSVRGPGEADEARLFAFDAELARFTERAVFDAHGALVTQHA